jgi:hypothetical protein
MPQDVFMSSTEVCQSIEFERISMLQHLQTKLDAAERAGAEQGITAALKSLRLLSISDFGELLWSMPNDQFPVLSSLLPRMTSVEAQLSWTGGCGRALLQDSTTFVRILQAKFVELWGRSLREAAILDYGCGYGRLL